MLNSNNRFFMSLFLSTLLLIIPNGCTLIENPDDQLAEELNYYETEEVSNILNATCAQSGCHEGNSPVNGFSTETQPQILLGASNRPLAGANNYGGDAIIPFNEEKSLLMQIIQGNVVDSLGENHDILSEDDISTIANWIDDGCKNHLGKAAFATPKSYRVYVCNQNTENVSVIDGTNKVVSRITDVNDPQTENDTPYWVAESGSFYYVTLSSAGKFIKLRKSDNSVVSSISGIINAGLIKINRTGTTAYVSRSLSTSNLYNSIYVIDLTSMSIIKTIGFGLNGLLHGMALDNTRNYLYVADAHNNLILVVNTLNNSIIDIRYTLTQNPFPLFLESSPYGNYLYISASNTNQLLVASTNSRSIVDKINVSADPLGISVSSTGDKIYVASYSGNAVDVITKTSNNWNKTNTITHPAMSMPFDMDITSNDQYIYVTNQNFYGDFVPAYQVMGEGNISTVAIINTSTESVEKVIEVEENAAGIAVEKL